MQYRRIALYISKLIHWNAYLMAPKIHLKTGFVNCVQFITFLIDFINVVLVSSRSKITKIQRVVKNIRYF